MGEDEGAVADEAWGLGPVGAGLEVSGLRIDGFVGFDQRRIDGIEDGETGEVDKVGSGAFEGDDEGARVWGAKLDNFVVCGESLLPKFFRGGFAGCAGEGTFGEFCERVDAPLVEIAAAFDEGKELGVIASGIRDEAATPGVAEVVGGDRLAVAPCGVGAEVEGVGEAIGRDFPAFGDAWHVGIFLGEDVVFGKSFVDESRDAEVLHPRHLREVESGDVASVDENKVGARLGAVAQDGDCDDQNERTDGREDL